MAQAEQPQRLRPDRQVTVDDVRQLMGASTPHFALQLRNRIRNMIDRLPAGHPVKIEGEREITRLDEIARGGEKRGQPAEPGLRPMPSIE